MSSYKFFIEKIEFCLIGDVLVECLNYKAQGPYGAKYGYISLNKEWILPAGTNSQITSKNGWLSLSFGEHSNNYAVSHPDHGLFYIEDNLIRLVDQFLIERYLLDKI